MIVIFVLEQGTCIEPNIYHLKGQLVLRFLKEVLICGEQGIVSDGKENKSKTVGTGLYLLKLKTAHKTTYQPVMLQK